MDTKKLRHKILDLAIHGKLVPQDPNDESASVLLERISNEKERLIKEGKIKRSKQAASSELSPDDVPFELPEGWCWTTLGEIAFYKKGPFGSSLTKSMFVPNSNEAYKVYEQKNAIQKNHLIGTYFIDSVKFEELKGFEVYPNDIIVSCAGTIGQTYVMPKNIKRGIINQALMIIRLFLNDIQVFYLLYFDFMLKEQATKESKGTAIKNIPPFDVLKNFYIPLPPLAEQQRIVSAVEQWMSVIDVLENNEEDLRQSIDKAKSKILDLAIRGKLVPQDSNDEPASELLKRLGISPDNCPCDDLPLSWSAPKVKDIFLINPKNKVEDDSIAGFVPMTNVSDGFSNKFTYEERKWGKIKKGYVHFQNGDIAVAKISPCLENRKSVIFSNLPNGIGAGTTELNIFRTSCAVIPEYALCFFKSKMFIDGCAGTYNGVVGQQRVAKNYIADKNIPLPPLAEQHRIVAKIEQLYSQLDEIESSLQS